LSCATAYWAFALAVFAGYLTLMLAGVFGWPF